VRLDQVAEEYGNNVEIQWRSFLLRPQPQDRSMESFTKYTRSWERPASIEPGAIFTTPWNGENEPPSHSAPPAIAGKVAMGYGPQTFHRFHRLLLEAYFTHNLTITDLDVLADLAVAAGIDRTEWIEQMAPSPHPLLQAVADDHNDAINFGVTGVPAMAVADQYLIPGAVDIEQYRRVIDHALAEADKET